MNRRPPDMDHPDNNPNMQQQQQPPQQQQVPYGARNRPSMNMQASFGTAGGQFPDLGNDIRRYSLSVAPQNTGLMMDQQQMLHQQHQTQQMMMQNQGGASANFRPDMNQGMMPSPGGTNYPQMMGAGDMSMAHRMHGLGNMFGVVGGAGGPGFMSSGSQRGSVGGGSTGEQDPRSYPGQGPSQGAMSQADREEELLLNLLIARRQRGSPGDAASAGQSQAIADELRRIRQNRVGMGAVGPMGQGGMYPDPMQQYSQAAATEMNERIDRSPNLMMDARSQEMLDISGRGMRRGFNADMMGHPQGFYGGMAPDALGPPKKKKRMHKKKPADMPRRPLSAYNLFFSEERERILKEIEEKEAGEESKEEGDDEATGKEEEDAPKTEVKSEETKETDPAEATATKPKALLRPLIPAEKKRRPHRKTHGKISFQQLARMVGERWKSLPDDRRKYYQGLATEDMKRQKAAMEEYYAKQNKAKAEEEKTAGRTIPGVMQGGSDHLV